MKTLKNYLILTATFSIIAILSISQVNAQSETMIQFLRPKQSLMSGGTAYALKIYHNDKLIGDLSNGVLINYTFTSDGEQTIKLQKELMGSVNGAPKIIKLNPEKGQTYYYLLEPGHNTIGFSEIDAKKAKKLTDKSKNFEATLDLNENSIN